MAYSFSVGSLVLEEAKSRTLAFKPRIHPWGNRYREVGGPSFTADCLETILSSDGAIWGLWGGLTIQFQGPDGLPFGHSGTRPPPCYLQPPLVIFMVILLKIGVYFQFLVKPCPFAIY